MILLTMIIIVGLTMALSWMHGWGDDLFPDRELFLESKGTLIAIMFIALLGLMAINYIGPYGWYEAGALLAGAGLNTACYWFFMRSGSFARAELDYMDRVPGSSLWKVTQNYLFAALCTGAIAFIGFYGQWANLSVLIVTMFAGIAAPTLIARASRSDDWRDQRHRRKQRERVEIIGAISSGMFVAVQHVSLVNMLNAL